MSYLGHLVNQSAIWVIDLIPDSLELGSDLVLRIRQKGIDPVQTGQVEIAWLTIKTCIYFNNFLFNCNSNGYSLNQHPVSTSSSPCLCVPQGEAVPAPALPPHLGLPDWSKVIAVPAGTWSGWASEVQGEFS